MIRTPIESAIARMVFFSIKNERGSEVTGFGYRVHTTGVERVATAHPPKRQSGASNQPMPLVGFQRVL